VDSTRGSYRSENDRTPLSAYSPGRFARPVGGGDLSGFRRKRTAAARRANIFDDPNAAASAPRSETERGGSDRVLQVPAGTTARKSGLSRWIACDRAENVFSSSFILLSLWLSTTNLPRRATGPQRTRLRDSQYYVSQLSSSIGYYLLLLLCVCASCVCICLSSGFFYTRVRHTLKRAPNAFFAFDSHMMLSQFSSSIEYLLSSLCVFYLPSFCLLHTRVRHANAQSRRHLPRGDAIAKARAWRAFLSHARVSLCGSARLLTLCGCRRAFVPGHSRPGDANGARSDGRSRPGLEAPSATRSCYGPRLHYRSQRREDAAGRAYGSIVLFQTLYMCPII